MILVDLRKLSVVDLEKELAKHQEEWLKFMIDIRSKEVKNIRQGRALKRNIARIKTVIHEKVLAT